MPQSSPAAKVCNVAAALLTQAEQQPDNAAIHYPTGLLDNQVQYASCSYRELETLSRSYAAGLSAYGLARGARVALMVPPGIDFFALFFALFRAGMVPVLIDPGIGLKPLKQCLGESAPEAFIGVTRAHMARVLLRWSPGTIKRKITIGRRLFWGGTTLEKLRQLGERAQNAEDPVLAPTEPEEIAAILFTSGSTGIPKGVVYRHRHFVHQVDMLRQAFGISPGEVDLATFPPFALFDPALGMTTVVPFMDPTRPAQANPEYLAQAIEQFGVTNLFGSPALLKVLGRYAQTNDRSFPGLRRIISAGAAVPADTIALMSRAMSADARVHTPYGATECLPVSSISNVELTPEVLEKTRAGAGICVGQAVPPNQVAIMRIMDKAADDLHPEDLLAPLELGEIVVHGPTTTDQYWQRDEQTRLAKTIDESGRLWHRMGDIGYRDEQGRIWYCGRKSQRVETATGALFPDQVEAVFNAHPAVERSALVGIPTAADAVHQRPVLCVERVKGLAAPDDDTLIRALIAMAKEHDSLAQIRHYLMHPGFPVDIRHNAKIGREQLSHWAADQLS